MNNITNSFEFLSNGAFPVSVIISLVFSIILLIVGLVLKSKGKSKGKNTVGWICVGIGSLSIISNVIQLII